MPPAGAIPCDPARSFEASDGRCQPLGRPLEQPSRSKGHALPIASISTFISSMTRMPSSRRQMNRPPSAQPRSPSPRDASNLTRLSRYSKRAGRSPIDKRYQATYPADIESLPRIIEVKTVGGSQRGWFLGSHLPSYEIP